MDEQVMAALCATYKGLTVDEIAEAIMSSSHADRVQDPQLLAEYVVACCEAY
jgi:hypothetical protein